MIDYPKMLYKGSIADSTIVEDEHEEQAAFQAGYVEHHELPDDVTMALDGWNDLLVSNKLPDDDKFPKDVESHIVNLEDQIVTLQLENIDLREQLAAHEANQHTDGQAQAATDTTSTDVGSVDYSDWTNSQLQEAIVDAGKTYNKRDSKAELINILQG